MRMPHGSVLLFQRSADARAFPWADDDDDRPGDDDGDAGAHPPTATTVSITIARRLVIVIGIISASFPARRAGSAPTAGSSRREASRACAPGTRPGRPRWAPAWCRPS